MKLLKFCDVYKLNLGIYMYKNPSRFSQASSVHDHSTRFSVSNYSTVFQRLTLTRNQSLYFQAPNNWNGIPQHIKNSETILQFKRKYKNFLLGQYSN